jgi:hypothetical protein
MTERWRAVAVPGFQKLYEVSTEGRVLSLHPLRRRRPGRRAKPRFLKLWKNKAGYMRVRLFREGKQYTFWLSRLVAMTFLGPIPPGMEVDHKNRNKEDNRLRNLQVVTPAENRRLAKVSGAYLRGEAHPGAKLTRVKVAEIRVLRGRGVPLKKIAQIYRVSLSRVSNIVNRKAWAHV